MTERANSEARFAFGRNWRSFLDTINEERVRVAERSLTEMLEAEDLRGRVYLDAGCGSGLFSLAACRLGASRVVSFDVDPDSVEATRQLKARMLPDADHWSIQTGDVTDRAYCEGLGIFDIVYSWGVLHHTGAMWQSMANTCVCIAPNGLLFIAIYNDQGRRSRAWRRVKRLYNLAPGPSRPLIAAIAVAPQELRAAVVSLVTGHIAEYVWSWRASDRRRGMSKWHDIVDWVGGYPFDVARPEEVLEFCRDRGLDLVKLRTTGDSSGCNQYVFERSGVGEHD